MKRRRLLRTIASGTAAGAVGLGRAAAEPDGNAPDRHVVGTDGPAASEIAERKADSVHRRLDFGDIGQAVAGRFPEPALEALERRPDVRYIEPEGQLRAIGEDLPWGVDRVDADLAHDDGYTGDGADVAIIDSGIDSDHPDLEANLGVGEAFVECGHYSDGSNCSDTNGNDCLEPWDDDNDHGSHCAGIADALDNSTGVVGVSTGATLHAVKVLACNGYGTYSDVAAGIAHVADQGWDVGSLSLGSSSDSDTIHDACRYAEDNGVLLVAAAGNDGPCSDCVLYPAAYPEVVAVSATESDDTLADFSCTGPEVELAAPGVNILSTVPGGTTYKSGTSMATPHVAGAAGLLMADGYSAPEARDTLGSSAEDVGLGSNEQGNGLVDAEAAVGSSGSSDALGETGSVETNQPDTGTWHSVSLNNAYSNPVVVMKPVSFEGGQPAHVRLRNVTGDSFEFQIEEWDYMDGAHLSETIHYVVLESGTHTLSDGTEVEAGTTGTTHEWNGVSFSQSFASTPVVFSQSQTVEGGQPVITRQRDVSTGGFDVRLQEEEGLDGNHYTESVGYIAIAPGGDSLHAAVASSDVTDDWHQISFSNSYSTSPVFVAQMQTFDGGNPGNVRYRNLTEDAAEVMIQEEKSADDEMNHRGEGVGYLTVPGGSDIQ